MTVNGVGVHAVDNGDAVPWAPSGRQGDPASVIMHYPPQPIVGSPFAVADELSRGEGLDGLASVGAVASTLTSLR